MITREILQVINSKLRSIIFYFILMGLVFFLLAVAILFYPNTLQIIFIVAFFIVSFSAFLTAAKLNHIKDIFDKALLFVQKKCKSK